MKKFNFSKVAGLHSLFSIMLDRLVEHLFSRTAFNGCFQRTTDINRHYVGEENVTTSLNISLEKNTSS